MELPSVINNEEKYAVCNWSSEDFEVNWDGKPIHLKAGETIELSSAIAFHVTKHFVNREMDKDKKSDVWSVQEHRQPYEEKTLSKIGVVVEEPAVVELKEKVEEEVAEVEGKPKKKAKKKAPKKADKEFAELEA